MFVILHRLIRLKFPPKKIDRVLKEIITKNTIQPKINLKNYYSYSPSVIRQLASIIWNNSVETLTGKKNFSININAYLAYEDLKVFSSSLMLKNLIYSDNFIKFIKNECILTDENFNNPENKTFKNSLTQIFSDAGFSLEKNDFLENFDIFTKLYFLYELSFPFDIDNLLSWGNENLTLSIDLKRLYWLNNQVKKSNNLLNEDVLESFYKETIRYREKNKSVFPVDQIILAEGITEEKLLPLFANIEGLNFAKKGIYLIAAGGKNQVEKFYKKYYEIFNIPIFILLDADAEEIANQLKSVLREKDTLYIISNGEFEDILSYKLIHKAVNNYYKQITQIKLSEINHTERMSMHLENLWKEKGLGDFNKAEFAKILSENITNKEDLSSELLDIVDMIKKTLT